MGTGTVIGWLEATVVSIYCLRRRGHLLLHLYSRTYTNRRVVTETRPTHNAVNKERKSELLSNGIPRRLLAAAFSSPLTQARTVVVE